MAAKFCENCGDPIADDEMFCEKCGTRLEKAQPTQTGSYQTQPVTQSYEPAKPVNQKNAVLAAVLSFLICGVGQMYNGQWKKGIVLLIVCILVAFLLGLVSLIVVVVAVYDAYTTAQKINNGEVVKDLFS